MLGLGHLLDAAGNSVLDVLSASIDHVEAMKVRRQPRPLWSEAQLRKIGTCIASAWLH